MLRKTPIHGFTEPIQSNIFVDGLRPQSKQLLDASAGGKIKLKTPEEAMALIENMAASDHAILRDRTHIPTKTKPVGTLFTRRIVGTEQVVNQRPYEQHT